MAREPKIWSTNWLQDSSLIQLATYEDVPDKETFTRDYLAGRPLDRDNVPSMIRQTGELRPMTDFFTVESGVMIISGKFAEVLQSFDIGPRPETKIRLRGADIFPIRFIDQNGDPIDGDFHLFQVSFYKDCFVPEGTEGARFLGPKWSIPSVRPFSLAVKHSTAEGPDIWVDPRMSRALFFSDRLRRALEDADITPSTFVPCREVEVRTIDRT